MELAKKPKLDKFVSKKKLTTKDWIELIEARAALIRPHLDSFPLKELGDYECFGPFGNRHGLNKYRPKVKANLKTQGIYSHNSRYDLSRTDKVSIFNKYIWGLTRQGEWILVTIEYDHIKPVRPNIDLEILSVKISRENLKRIITISHCEPITIWFALGYQIGEWETKREKLYDEAHDLAEIVRTEELVYEAMGK